MTIESLENHGVAGMLAGLEASVRRLRLPGRRVLIAVSGGPDSVALTHGLSRLAAKFEYTLHVAIIDHGLRPESTNEVDLVREHSRSLGLTFHTKRLRLTTTAGVEAAARVARYQALSELRSAAQLELIATGHTASDQAETVLMRLGRGASLRGAVGIQSERVDGVVRPLLFATRGETLAFVRALGLTVANDPMNFDTTFARVRMRQTVVPALSGALGPHVERSLARFAALAAEDEAYLEREAGRCWDLAVCADGSLDAFRVRALPPSLQRRVLVRLLEAHEVPVDSRLIDRALAGVAASRRVTCPRDLLLSCDNGRVRVVEAPPRKVSLFVSVPQRAEP
jgi:tRNA(Ile)-lysidine synthase